ncbi:LPS translocon maturation chaperone LptM [Silanimonas lenta]|jgi:predicted small lipoprotein YifL|nr:lipoprotein [Silanimonas lenta]
MKRPCLALVLIAATLLLLAACGNKGDLVRPSPKAEAALA